MSAIQCTCVEFDNGTSYRDVEKDVSMCKRLASGIKIWVISNMEARVESIKASELPWRAGCKERKLSSEN